MILEEKRLFVRKEKNKSLISHFRDEIMSFCKRINAIPIRFVVTETSEQGYQCEIGVMFDDLERKGDFAKIFNLRKRKFKNENKFNAVVIVPTGIGAKLGGHSGDSGAMVRLLSSICDTLVTHPNVVNAADINEIPDNTLYVEGSIINRFLMGTAGLQKVRCNRVLVVMEEHTDKMFHELAINSVSAARTTLGMNVTKIIKMKRRVIMRAIFAESGRAIGRIEYFERLQEVLNCHKEEFDAVALTSLIEVPKEYHKEYFVKDMEVNPWGGVEAMLTHAVSSLYDVPSAHSPMMTSSEVMNLDVGVVDPRKSAEVVSTTYLHCILKGLHRSPQIINLSDGNIPKDVLSIEDVTCLILPEGCLGLPTLAALEQGLYVIIVKENKNCMKNRLERLPFRSKKLLIANNYLEAVGLMAAIKAGISPDTVRRPIALSDISDFIPVKELDKKDIASLKLVT